MTRMRTWAYAGLIVTPAVLALGAGAALAAEQTPTAAAQTSINADTSEAAKAAAANKLGQQSTVPDLGGNKSTIGQTQGDGGTGGMPIGGKTSAGVNNLNTPGTVPAPNNSQGAQGIDVSKGGFNANLPGGINSDTQSNIDKANAEIAKEAAQGRAEIDKALQGGSNALNIPTSAAPGVDRADGGISGFLSSVWSSITGGSGGEKGSDNGKKSEFNSSSTAGNVGNTDKQSSSGEKKAGPEGKADGFQESAQIQDANGNVSYRTTSCSPAGPDGKTNCVESILSDKSISRSPGKKYTPSDDSSSGEIGGLSARSSYGKKDQGGGAGNNSETSTAKSTTLSPNSSFAKRTHGDGGSDNGDNNNHIRNGGLSATTSLGRKDQGDGGSADSRGGAGATGPKGAQTVHPGSGHNELSNKPAIVGGGLLDGESGLSARGPAAVGAGAAAATSGLHMTH